MRRRDLEGLLAEERDARTTRGRDRGLPALEGRLHGSVEVEPGEDLREPARRLERRVEVHDLRSERAEEVHAPGRRRERRPQRDDPLGADLRDELAGRLVHGLPVGRPARGRQDVLGSVPLAVDHVEVIRGVGEHRPLRDRFPEELHEVVAPRPGGDQARVERLLEALELRRVALDRLGAAREHDHAPARTCGERKRERHRGAPVAAPVPEGDAPRAVDHDGRRLLVAEDAAAEGEDESERDPAAPHRFTSSVRGTTRGSPAPSIVTFPV